MTTDTFLAKHAEEIRIISIILFWFVHAAQLTPKTVINFQIKISHESVELSCWLKKQIQLFKLIQYWTIQIGIFEDPVQAMGEMAFQTKLSKRKKSHGMHVQILLFIKCFLVSPNHLTPQKISIERYKLYLTTSAGLWATDLWYFGSRMSSQTENKNSLLLQAVASNHQCPGNFFKIRLSDIRGWQPSSWTHHT